MEANQVKSMMFRAMQMGRESLLERDDLKAWMRGLKTETLYISDCLDSARDGAA